MTTHVDDDGHNIFADADGDHHHDEAEHEDHHDDVPAFYPQLNALKSKPTALLSIVGSYIVIREVLRDHREVGAARHQRSKVIPRLLLAMSISDIFFSVPYFLTTWMAPAELDDEILWGNIGTQATCTFQATLFQFGVTSGPLFNAFLAFFSLLMVRYNWTSSRLARAEKGVHASIWIFAFVCALFPVPLGVYNFAHDICWFAAAPLDCKTTHQHGDEANCHRGDDAWIYAIAFHVFPSWTCVIASAIMMAMLYLHVRRLEDRAHRWTSVSASVNAANAVAVASASVNAANVASSTLAESATIAREEKDRRKSKAVAERAILYICAFLFTNVGDFVAHTLWYAYGYEILWLDFVSFVLFPMQGFLTFVIFARKRKMKTPEGRFLRRFLFDWLCCCVCPNSPKRPRTSSTTSSNQETFGAEQTQGVESNVVSVTEEAGATCIS